MSQRNINADSPQVISLFPDAWMTKPIETLTLAQLIAAIQSDRWSSEVETYRWEMLLHGKNAAKPLKLALPAVTAAGQFAERRNDGLTKYSGYIVVDIDGLGADRAQEIRSEARKDKHTVGAFISPSLDGVKLFYSVSTGPEQHGAAWQSAAQYVRSKYNVDVEVDKTGKELARLCFVSADEGAFFNKAATPLPMTAASSPPRPTATAEDDLIGDFDQLPSPDVTLEIVESLLEVLDPDMPRADWLEVAASLRHQFPHEPDASTAYELFHQWSEKAKARYTGAEDVQALWSSIKPVPKGRIPITIASLYSKAKEKGWTPDKKHAESVKELLESRNLASEALRRAVLEKMATLKLSRTTRDELLESLRTKLRRTGEQVPTLKVLRDELSELLQQRYRKNPEPLPSWAKDYCFVGGKHNEFYHALNGYAHTPDSFDHFYRQVMPGNELPPHEYLLTACALPRVHEKMYDPSAALFFKERELDCVNLYRHTYPASDFERAAIAGRLLERHIENLILEPEYGILLLDWMAYLIQCPGEKVLWAPLIQGAQGCGKSSLADVMRCVLGETNVRRLEASRSLESQFNDFAAGSQLVAFDEVRNVGENAHRVLETLKPLITDAHVEVNRKFIAAQNVRNVTNYILFTNHHDALPINDHERRFFVLKSPLQTTQAINEKSITACCAELHAYLHDYPGAFRAYLETWAISEAFEPKGHAPSTPYKGEMTRAAETPLKAAVREAIEGSDQPALQPDLLAFDALYSVLLAQPGLVRVTHQSVAKVLSELSYERLGEHSIKGTRRKLWALRGSAFNPIGSKDAVEEFKQRTENETPFQLLSATP